MPKEVIHLTLGTLAHHTSTHFFNQQSSHFQYPDASQLGRKDGEDGEENEGRADLILDPNVDFQEGVGKIRGEQTFFPRQVVVDFKDSLGTRWDAYDVVYDEEEEEQDDQYGSGYDQNPGILRPSRAANEGLHAWGRQAEVLRTKGTAEGIQSTRLGPVGDEDEDEEDEYETDDEDQSANLTPRKARYSRPSAFAHNPLHPRSARCLPSVFGGGVLSPMAHHPENEGRTPFSSFEMGMGLAKSMDKEDSFLDENLRWFAEDSDHLQSFSLSLSTFDGFSGMAHEMLQMLADEYPKTPVLAWGLECPGQRSNAVDELERMDRIRMTNKVLSLWSLSSASLYVPLASPPTVKQQHLSSRVDWSDMYSSGGLFAAHIDTATLTSRLHDERQRQPVSSFVQGLNWRRNTPIASLAGALPTPFLAPVREAERPLDPIEALLAARGYDPRKQLRQNAREDTVEARAATAAKEIDRYDVCLTPNGLGTSKRAGKARRSTPFAQIATARDGDVMAAQPNLGALEAWTRLDEPAGRSSFVPLPFNVRSATFPRLFSRLTVDGRPRARARQDGDKSKRMRNQVETVPVLSSLSTTPDTAFLLSDARKWIDDALIKGHAPLASYGLGGSRGRSGAGQAASDETEGFLGGREGLVEIREHLEELLGAYEEGFDRVLTNPGDEGDQVGTDEEFAGQDGDSDWDLE